jgi:hypothetical protein
MGAAAVLVACFLLLDVLPNDIKPASVGIPPQRPDEPMPNGDPQRQMRRFAGSCRYVFNRALGVDTSRMGLAILMPIA